MTLKQTISRSSLAALAGMIVHYLACYARGYPILTDAAAEWIMARTPSAWAVPLLEALGSWAKPFAATGGLATLGFLLWLPLLLKPRWAQAIAAVASIAAFCWALDYTSLPGTIAFLIPALLILLSPAREILKTPVSARREFLTSAAMLSGTALVAVEARVRADRFAAQATEPVPLFRWSVPQARIDWGKGLVRKPVTNTREFYVMSKNTVDPLVDPKRWRLKIYDNDKLLREFSYAELLSLPRQERFVTLRCISNTLKSDLMGTAAWSGVEINQLVRRAELSDGNIEMAVIGLDGHGDSYKLDYAFTNEPMLALGMNGDTLSRNHGYPIRLLTPRYFGFKSIKWLAEIRFTRTPYFGTWPKQGYTKEPLVHTATFIDRIQRSGDQAKVGGVSFAGVRGVQRVEVRANNGDWTAVELETPLSPHTLTRWRGEIIVPSGAQWMEARALDGEGKWQADTEHPLFPDGVSGPTIKKLA